MINFIIYFKSCRTQTTAFKVFTLYIFSYLIIQFITAYYHIYKIDNIHLSHYYFIIQFITLSAFFYIITSYNMLKKVITTVLIITLSSIAVYYYYYPGDYYAFNIFEILVTSVPLIIYSLLFFIEKIDNHDKKYLFSISGFFVYMLCSLLLFSASKVSSDIKIIIWFTNALLIIVYQILIFIEWYKHFRKPEISD